MYYSKPRRFNVYRDSIFKVLSDTTFNPANTSSLNSSIPNANAPHVTSPLKNTTTNIDQDQELPEFDDFDMDPPPLPRNVDYVDEFFSTNNINAAVRSVSPKKPNQIYNNKRRVDVFRDEPIPILTAGVSLKSRLFNQDSSRNNKLNQNSSGPLQDITNTSRHTASNTGLQKPEKWLESSALHSFKDHTTQVSLQPSDFNLPPKSTSTPQDTTALQTPINLLPQRSSFVQSTPLNRSIWRVNTYTTPTRQFDAFSTPKRDVDMSMSDDLSPVIHTNMSILSSSFNEDISVDDSLDLYESPLAQRHHRLMKGNKVPQLLSKPKRTEDDLAHVVQKLRNSKISSDYSPLNTSDCINFDGQDINNLNSLFISSDGYAESINMIRSSPDCTMDTKAKKKKKVRIHEHVLVISSDPKTRTVRKRSLRSANSSNEDLMTPLASRKKPRKSISRSSTPRPRKSAIRSHQEVNEIGSSSMSTDATFSDMLKLVPGGKDPIDLLD
ncbi:hypothetical protein WICPIJ_001303 [Wickerhamomyces pijperi]|uniref:Uncharacterized protein n=1 Tax=Wickerhamomyces pijperi TaxID=599730 RepID=A0A9P8QE11_WICPI|nr:hypothetical protein WICPIJ_001303 [Wickerhamomyces pijperi]